MKHHTSHNSGSPTTRSRGAALSALAVPLIVGIAPAACGSAGADGHSGHGGHGGHAGEHVVVKPGETATVPADTCSRDVGTIMVEGTYIVPDDKDITICARAIIVQNGGRLQIGTKERPFTHRATITLVGSDTAADIHGMGTKVIGAMSGGVLDLHGSPPAATWTKLAGPVAQGASSFEVLDPRGWAVGQEIVIASGTVEPGETETRVIKAIDGNRITVDAPLKHARGGTLRTVEGRTVDTRTEVGVLSRNIVIQGDEASDAIRFGGHVMVMAGGKAYVDGVEFRRMGQFDRLGRYPFHWHLVGDVSGQYITNSVVSRSFQRGIVVHSVQNARIAGNIVFDTVGHNYICETPDTVDNTWEKNLGLVTRIANFTESTLATQGDDEPANYWIRAAKNAFLGNSAAGSIASGFWYDSVLDSGAMFRANIAHSSKGRATDAPEQKSKIDFNRESGLLVQFPDETNTLINEFESSTFFQNNVDIWPQDGVQRYVDMVFAEPAGVSVIIEGTYVTFERPLFAGPAVGKSTAPSILAQYNGKAVLRDPTFVNSGLLAANDIFLPWTADFVVSGAKLVGIDRSSVDVPDQAVVEAVDDTFLPRGFYVRRDVPLIASNFSPALGAGEIYRSPSRAVYAVLGASVSGNLVSDDNAFIRRSDGTRYRDPGFRGFRVIANSTFTYQLESPPPANEVDYSLDAGHERQTTVYPGFDTIGIEVAVPVTGAPRRVEYPPTAEGAPPARTLAAAASLAAFRQSPSTTYFYDAGAGLLYIQVTAKNAVRVAR
jgi:hypothetical protein